MSDDFFDDLFRVDEEEEFMLFCMMEDERRERKEKEKEERLLFGDSDDDDDDDDDSDELFFGGSTFSRSSSPAKTPPLYLSAPLMNEANPVPESVSADEFKRCKSDINTSAVSSIIATLLLSFIPVLIMWVTFSDVYDPLDKGSGWFTLIIVLAGLGFIGLVLKAIGTSFGKEWKRYSAIKSVYLTSMTQEERAEWDRARRKRTAAVIVIMALLLAALIAMSASCNRASDSRDSGSQVDYSTTRRTTRATRATTRTTRRTTQATRHTTRKTTKKSNGAFDVDDFNNPEDFYDWYWDDFVDYEDAEDYYYEHGGR